MDIACQDINRLHDNSLQAIDTETVGVCISGGYTSAVRTVGKNIARIREARGWSQVDLADRLKMRQPSLWKMEHSKAIPKGKTLLKLAASLECSVEELLRGVHDVYDEQMNARGQTESVASVTKPAITIDDADMASKWARLLPDQRDTVRRVAQSLIRATLQGEEAPREEPKNQTRDQRGRGRADRKAR